MKIVSVIGARPQFIKISVITNLLKDLEYMKIKHVLVHTGQHFDDEMSKVFFEELDIPKPDYNLDIHSLNHGAMTGRMIEKIEEVLIKEKPDLVLVYGDTNSTLAGVLSAIKLNISIGHIESGLRSFNFKMPEEINRIVADRLSTFLFCPTDTSIENLFFEGRRNEIYDTGDIMYDAFLMNKDLIKERTIAKDLKLDDKKYILLTIHRPENTDNYDKMFNILSTLYSMDYNFVFPIHPRTKQKIKDFNLEKFINSNILCIDPVGYLDMLKLESCSGLVITDSGGVQREAFFNRVPAIILRDQTEWVELIKEKFHILLDTDPKLIRYWIDRKFGTEIKRQPMIFGNGDTSKKILDVIVEKFKDKF